MTTSETNRLIAEFMGGLHSVDAKGRNCIDFFEGVRLRNRILVAHLRYHSSWDWLMRVWVKLNQGPISESCYDRVHNLIDLGDIDKCYAAIVDELAALNSLNKL